MSEEDKKVTVDIFGQKVEMSQEQATAIIAGRDEGKARLTELQVSNTERVAAEELAKKAATDAESLRVADEAAKNGELKQLKDLHASQLRESQTSLKRVMIRQAVAGNEKIARTALSDVADALSAHNNVELIDDKLIVNKTDGTKTTFESHLEDFIKDRKHFQSAEKLSNGSGGDGDTKKESEIPEITYEEYDSNKQHYGAEIQAGKVKIKEE